MNTKYAKGNENARKQIWRWSLIVCLLLASCNPRTHTVAPFITTAPETPIPAVTPSAIIKPDTPASTSIQPTKTLASIPTTNDILTIGVEWQENWVRSFNPFSTQSVYLPCYCIYETLLVYNSITGEFVPWLATEYTWGVNSQALTFNLRRGVQWSDGKPFSAEDVVSTFEMEMNHSDISGERSEWLKENVAEISAPDGFTVVFKFKTVNTLALYPLATAMILPKHIWGKLDTPTEFVDSDPVGTGPFTQVTLFQDKGTGLERILQLERNPYYWQKDKLSIQGVKFSFRHSEYTLQDLAQGKLDWAAVEIPNIHKDFLDLDPTHYQVLIDDYSYDMNLLQLNTARPPFDNPDVRKAISMSIDRHKMAEAISQGYLEPANVVGLNNRLKSWWNEEAIHAGTWTENNPDQANALLDSLGYKKGADGTRVTPEGKPMIYKLITAQGSPEQDTVAKIISLSLANIGVVVTASPDEKWWDDFVADNYDMALFGDFYGFYNTPYEFYAGLMSPTGLPLVGAKTNKDAGRYSSPEAGSLLDQFIQESDPLRQKAIMDQIEAIFVKDAPSIPLYSGFGFIEYNTWRFIGFPSSDDPYAEGEPGNILVIFNLKPR